MKKLLLKKGIRDLHDRGFWTYLMIAELFSSTVEEIKKTYSKALCKKCRVESTSAGNAKYCKQCGIDTRKCNLEKANAVYRRKHNGFTKQLSVEKSFSAEESEMWD